MKFALVKFRIHLIGSAFRDLYGSCVCTHCDSVATPLSAYGLFVIILGGINCVVQYNPGKQHALANALSRRPDYELAHVTTLSSSVTDLIRTAYVRDHVRGSMDIVSITACCAIARILRILLVSFSLMMRN